MECSLNGAMHRTLRDLIRACLLYLRLNHLYFIFSLTAEHMQINCIVNENSDDANSWSISNIPIYREQTVDEHAQRTWLRFTSERGL